MKSLLKLLVIFLLTLGLLVEHSNADFVDAAEPRESGMPVTSNLLPIGSPVLQPVFDLVPPNPGEDSNNTFVPKRHVSAPEPGGVILLFWLGVYVAWRVRNAK